MNDSLKQMLPIQAAFEAATGLRVATTTAWRYCTTGSRGVRLKHWNLGCKRVTTPEEVLSWMEAVTIASAGGKVKPQPPKKSRKDKALDAALDVELS